MVRRVSYPDRDHRHGPTFGEDMNALDTKPPGGDDGWPRLIVWHRPLTGKRRRWRVIGTAETEAEALGLMKGVGEWASVAPGVMPVRADFSRRTIASNLSAGPP